MKKILVTGTTGFVGTVLSRNLEKNGYDVIKTTRKSSVHEKNTYNTGDIDADTDWHDALADVDTVIHLVARVHQMGKESPEELEKYFTINTRGTEKLVSSAVNANVRRFIYLSTIKVNGENTNNAVFTCNDIPHPHGHYAVSKLGAEKILKDISKNSEIEIVIIRPTLVYGPGVKGNFIKLIDLINKGYPLPFKGVKNKRSLISINNLISLIKKCIEHPNAKGKIFLASDDTVYSTAGLIKQISISLDKKPRIFHVPPIILKITGILTGRKQTIGRLLDSLEIDQSMTKRVLEWKPPYSAADEINMTVQWYKRSK